VAGQGKTGAGFGFRFVDVNTLTLQGNTASNNALGGVSFQNGGSSSFVPSYQNTIKNSNFCNRDSNNVQVGYPLQIVLDGSSNRVTKWQGQTYAAGTAPPMTFRVCQFSISVCAQQAIASLCSLPLASLTHIPLGFMSSFLRIIVVFAVDSISTRPPVCMRSNPTAPDLK